MQMPTFVDRRQAGQVLAKRLEGYVGRSDVVILGLPRGVPVAAEVARELDAPLDVLVVRKLGLPGFDEIAMGAMGPAGVTLIEWGTVARFGVTGGAVASAVARERAELARREAAFRGTASPVGLTDRTVIVVDDGLATGASLRAAITAARQRGAARVVVAVPICTPELCAELRDVVDALECALTPEPCLAVGLWYGDFEPTPDDEVRRLLAESRRYARTTAVASSSVPPPA
jgi:putative phosphoribosyl transferase